MYRQTYVVEYQRAEDAPRVGAQEVLGGTLVAAQFSDALAEIDAQAEELTRLRAEVEALREFRESVLRCRYPVCKSLYAAGVGWDIERLNEVVDAARAALGQEKGS